MVAWIEIKTTVSSQWFPRKTLYQLLGYVLLDYPDEHRIRSVGIYFARQARLVRWTYSEMISRQRSGLGLVGPSPDDQVGRRQAV